jgi:hypothetical protein
MNRSIPPLLLLALAAPTFAQSTKPSAPATASATQPLTLEQERAKNKKSAEEEFAGLQPIPSCSIAQLFDLIIDRDQLVLVPKLAATNNDPKRVEITDFPGLASVRVGTDKDSASQITSMQMQHYSFDGPGVRVKITQLLAPPAYLHIAQGIDAEKFSVDVSLMRQPEDQGDPNSKIVTTMYVTKFGPDEGDVIAKLSLKADSFVALRRKYPRETQAYLVPILRDLHQTDVLAVDSLVARQVLGGKSKVSDEMLAKIKAALAKFDSDKFQERESAAKDLQSLGGEAALYLREAPRTGWSQEQTNGVDAFLASFSTIAPEEAEKLAASPAFLLDVLYSDDAGLRQAAVDRLKKIAKDKPMNYDDNAPLEKRLDQIDRLSHDLLGAPATQLSTDKPVPVESDSAR